MSKIRTIDTQNNSDTIMDVLEAREQRLRAQLFGTQPAAATSGCITDKVADLDARLEHLYGAIAGFSRLCEMCTSRSRSRYVSPCVLLTY